MSGEAYREIRTCQVRATDLKVGDVFDATTADSLAGNWSADEHGRWVEVTEVGQADGQARIEFKRPRTVGLVEDVTITWLPKRFELVTIQWTFMP